MQKREQIALDTLLDNQVQELQETLRDVNEIQPWTPDYQVQERLMDLPKVNKGRPRYLVNNPLISTQPNESIIGQLKQFDQQKIRFSRANNEPLFNHKHQSPLYKQKREVLINKFFRNKVNEKMKETQRDPQIFLMSTMKLKQFELKNLFNDRKPAINKQFQLIRQRDTLSDFRNDQKSDRTRLHQTTSPLVQKLLKKPKKVQNVLPSLDPNNESLLILSYDPQISKRNKDSALSLYHQSMKLQSNELLNILDKNSQRSKNTIYRGRYYEVHLKRRPEFLLNKTHINIQQDLRSPTSII